MDKLEGGRASPSGGDIKHDIELDKSLETDALRAVPASL